MARTSSLLCLLSAIACRLVAALSHTCSSGAVAQYTPLYRYAPANSFCSQHRPDVASAASIQMCSPYSRTQNKRQSSYGSGWTANNGGSGWQGSAQSWPSYWTQSSRPQSQSSAEDVLLQALTASSNRTITTFCSCLANPAFTIETITCPSGSHCSASGVCVVERDCQNPARCDASSFCGYGSTGDTLFCHPDIDDVTQGYCMNDGPPGASCPQPDEYEDCASNADCGNAQRVCIFSCCREQPFCVTVANYTNSTVAGGIT